MKIKHYTNMPKNRILYQNVFRHFSFDVYFSKLLNCTRFWNNQRIYSKYLLKDVLSNCHSIKALLHSKHPKKVLTNSFMAQHNTAWSQAILYIEFQYRKWPSLLQTVSSTILLSKQLYLQKSHRLYSLLWQVKN